ncbi:MAG: hypothetical protein R6T83_06610 [Salinibacter sp.]
MAALICTFSRRSFALADLNRMRILSLLFLLALGLVCAGPASAQPLYDSDAFTLTDTSVVQGDFRAVAASRTRLTSNYQRETRRINFKFSLNRRDNERPSGDDRRLRVDPADGLYQTPVYVFGERQDEAVPQPTTVRERSDGDSVDVVFRVDLRPVLRSFRETGSYTPPEGDPIAADDFEGVWILGDTEPLSWSADELAEDGPLRLTDPDEDGVYRTTIPFATRDLRPLDEAGRAVWSQSADGAEYPAYESDHRLVDALYNLSLEELQQNIRDDGALMAGAKWTGVWTRDISYSILLSLALLEPDAAKTSLRQKVTDDGRIIQDTGTGGSWPVSTDRMTWALAAWEAYLTTGDEDWLRDSYDIIRRSADADLQTAFDSTRGLFYGETSFMDWREQSYPDWMEPVDIYQSQGLSTNVVHYRTYRILTQMAGVLGEPSARWRRTAQQVKEGINEHLWREDAGRYSAYRYGRTFRASTPRAEALGNALAVLSGSTDEARATRVAQNQPVVDFGVPSLWPYIPDIPPYHNAGIWPFVGAYWTWASAEAENTPGVEHGLASMYRAAALFLTNKENMVAQTGHFEGTEINSDRQLWSVAGTLATVYRVFFGMRFTPDGLRFDPFVPPGYSGTHTLEAVPYRDATLDVTVRGYGTRVVQATLDGEPIDEPVLPADLEGDHEVRLVLNGSVPEGERRMTTNRYSPATPEVRREANELQWDAVEDAYSYRIYRNGASVDTTVRPRLSVTEDSTLAEYQVQAIGNQGHLSFRSEPVRVVADSAVQTVQPSDSLSTEHDGYTGEGYRALTQEANREVTLEVTVPETGRYALDVRYANGHGPINTDNKAAIRSVRVDGRRLGAVVFPQRGAGAWTDWGYTNVLRTALEAGTHEVTIAFTESDQNMNGDVNAAHLDHLRVTPLPNDSDE